MDVAIQPMDERHWPEVRRIYLDGIRSRNATFATEAPSWDEWDSGHLATCRLIASEGEAILGWAALSAVSSRCVYAGVAEVSVYVDAAARGSGLGTRLLAALVEASESHDIWTLQAGIFPENHASVGAHRACGFREVGRREKLGKMDGAWRDVLLLERRSAVAGA